MHNLTVREDGKVEFAFIGSRDAIWHGLGQQLTTGAPIETWIKEAGLDWSILESELRYEFNIPGVGNVSKVFDNKKALFRSDTKQSLSIVGETYQVVQPAQVLEFFRDLTSAHGFVLSAAGSLSGGNRFWATAETGMVDEVSKGDTVGGHLLLVSSSDGTMSTTAKFTSTRTVCNNTLNVALNDNSKDVVKVTHKSIFNPEDIKIDLGILNESWETYMGNLKKMSSVSMSDADALKFYKELEFDPDFAEDEQDVATQRRVAEIMSLYQNGAGAEPGSVFGVLNGITNFYTHGPSNSRKSDSSRFMYGYFGEGDKMKNYSYNRLLEMV